MHLIIAFCHDGKPGSVCKHRWFGLLKRSYKANQPDRKSQMWMVCLILLLVRFALLPIITDIWRPRVASLLVENTQRKLLDMLCLLDATKAFDCVRYDKRFELLLKNDIPGIVIRLLLDSYTRQYA